MEAINRLFTPEFRNRLDAIIPFGSLPVPVVHQVVQKFVMQLEAQLSERGVTFDLSPEAIAWLADKGYDERMGARPLGRVIQEHIKKPLADEVLFGKLKKGGTVRVTVETKDDGETGLKLESLADELPVKPKKEEPAEGRAQKAAAKTAAKKPAAAKAEADAQGHGRRQAQPGAATAPQGLSSTLESAKRTPRGVLLRPSGQKTIDQEKPERYRRVDEPDLRQTRREEVERREGHDRSNRDADTVLLTLIPGAHPEGRTGVRTRPSSPVTSRPPSAS